MSPILRTMTVLAAGLLAFDPASLASDKTDKTERKEKRTIVVQSKDDGEPLVWSDDGDGPVRVQVKAVKRGFLGVVLNDMTPELRTYFGAPEDAGVLVTKVEADSPAGRAGIKVGDVITAADGDKTDNTSDLTRAIRTRKDGETIALELWRDRRVQTVNATIVERDRQQFDVGDVLMFKGGEPLLERNFDVHVDPDKLNEMVERMQKQFQSPEFKQRLQRYQDMEKRMQELEKKLQEMDKKLRERSALGAAAPRS